MDGRTSPDISSARTAEDEEEKQRKVQLGEKAYLYGRDVGQARQILRVGNGGYELDGANDGAGGSAICVGIGHAGARGAGRAGSAHVVQRRHRKWTSMPWVGMLQEQNKVKGDG